MATAREAGKCPQEVKQTTFGEFIVSAKLREGPSQDQDGVWEEVGAAGKGKAD